MNRRAPQVPSPDVIAGSVASGAKAVAGAGVGSGQAVADGAKTIVISTINDVTSLINNAAKAVCSLAEKDLSTGKQTVEGVIRQVQSGADQVVSSVDQGLGKEVVQKFKREVESQLRL